MNDLKAQHAAYSTTQSTLGSRHSHHRGRPGDCMTSSQSVCRLKPRAVLRNMAPKPTSLSNKIFLLTASCLRSTTMSAPFDPIQAAFQNAMSGFQAELKDDEVYNNILQITTIDQVYDATDKIQKEQAKQGHLRHLAKIGPYLDRLNEYAASIEVFIQVKPDVLALIWGPIKLLLQWASALKNSFDAIVNTMADISELLPEFKRVTTLFDQNAAIKDVMVLFFRDILDFYLVALKFFKLPRLKYLFDSLWPRHKDKIKVVMTHIENHARLMRNEVRLEHIQQEYEARRRALEHFEKEDRSRRAQEFHRIRTDIAPQSHDHRFDWLRARVCQGTGTWLLQNATFKEWLQATAESSRILWLQGIPGAGKTYLASTVIARVQSLGRTAFAFLSYKENRNATAISVLHSLIFRVVSGEDDLQTVVCQSCNEESKRSLQGATELLTTVLACAGPVYLIVDGLDEIDEVERRRLLTQLLLILKSSHEVRLFISSRAEADLNSILSSGVTVLRVDQRNSECIQTFVKQWARRWFIEREFLPEEQTEIEAGLTPLAAKSQGMFLYARVVLNSIEFLASFVDIREELHILPETLNDAYGRILKRINSLDYTAKEKARAILGWVACSPTPLTVQEVQQALIIDLKPPGNLGVVCGNLNLVRICGPIVEVVDDYIQFVHFTVKEYLFSSQIPGFIDVDLATLDLALRCVTYLCQAHHDLSLDDNEVSHNTLTGAYVLDWFATNMWPQLIKNYLRVTRQDKPHPELVQHLKKLHATRIKNQSLGRDDFNELFPDLHAFKEAHPAAYALIGEALRFRQICTASEHYMRQGAPWINLDPLTTSAASVRIYQAIEELLLGESQEMGESYTKMRRWYGQRPYKCEYLHCEFNRVGFQFASERNSHKKYHDRPWKCSISGCEYAEGGFLTRKMRDDHLDQAHFSQNKQVIGLGHANDDDENSLLLLDLAKAGLVDCVQDLMSNFDFKAWINSESFDTWIGGRQEGGKWIEEMCEAAVLSGSLPMVELCISKLDYGTNTTWKGVTALAIRWGSAETFEYSLNHCPKLCISTTWWVEMISRGDHEMLEIWIKFSKNRAWSHDRKRLDSYKELKASLTKAKVIRATANDRLKEELLLRLWRSIQMERRDLGDILVAVASTTCSVALAEYVLEAGAEVDYRRSVKYDTSLRHAARRDTAEAAALMKLLLLRGADPDVQREPFGSTRGWKSKFATNIRDEKGPRGISKWLGITWDELVKETQGLKHPETENISKAQDP
ncbi:NACHT domain protein [Biscogniauxia mediterranea]|nr:NACHT domain protein [Biscogniauxia mediterranea]